MTLIGDLTSMVTGGSALVVVAPVVHHRLAFSILGAALLFSDFLYGKRVAAGVRVVTTTITNVRTSSPRRAPGRTGSGSTAVSASSSRVQRPAC